MKKLLSMFIAAAMLITIGSCAAKESAADGMPKPFSDAQGGGAENVPFYLITENGEGVLTLNSICYDTFVSDSECMAWYKEAEAKGYLTTPQTSISEYPNMYSFIKKFDVPIDKIREYYEGILRLHYELGVHCLPQEGIDVLCTLDEAKILEYFVSKYAIYSGGDKAYSPAWIYYHTPEDYAKAGITPEMVAEKLALYNDFAFTAEAAGAFEDKLSAFTGESVALKGAITSE